MDTHLMCVCAHLFRFVLCYKNLWEWALAETHIARSIIIASPPKAGEHETLNQQQKIKQKQKHSKKKAPVQSAHIWILKSSSSSSKKNRTILFPIQCSRFQAYFLYLEIWNIKSHCFDIMRRANRKKRGIWNIFLHDWLPKSGDAFIFFSCCLFLLTIFFVNQKKI